MRKKYNIFRVSKINKTTIEISLKLKKKMEKTRSFKEEFRSIPLNLLPIEDDKLLAHLSYTYLYLKPEDGVPLIKKAFKIQHNVEDECDKCRQCGKIFYFQRKSKVFCSNRCRQRFYRNKRVE